MQWSDLNLNRFGFKAEPDPVDAGAAEMSVDSNNSTPVNTMLGNRSGEKTANQVITGTVITDCIIRTSALPNRVEMLDNDINFYEDTTGGGGTVVGNTATLNFYRSDDTTKYFRMQKRAGKDDDLDNVFEFFSSPPATGKHNFMFFGNAGTFDQANTAVLSFYADIKMGEAAGVANGKIQMGLTRDGGHADTLSLLLTDSRAVFSNNAIEGVCALTVGVADGVAGIGYRINSTTVDIGIYQGNYNAVAGTTVSGNELFLSHRLFPDQTNAYDIGASTNTVRDVWVGRKLNVGKVTDAGPMSATAGTAGDIVFNLSDTKFYGCTVSGNPATWVALS